MTKSSASPATHHPPHTQSEAFPASLPHDEDVDVAIADEEPKIKPQPRKKKLKKVVLIGRNGLKKRRVEKSRTRFGEKSFVGASIPVFIFGGLHLLECGIRSPFVLLSVIEHVNIFMLEANRRIRLLLIRLSVYMVG